MNDVKTINQRTRAAGWLLGLLAIAVTTGCGPGSGSPAALVLPTDTLLNLACAEVGVNDEQCVLDDPENPFRHVAVANFDDALEMQGLPQPPNYKFFLADDIPPGPSGAKARFYLWATALALQPSGENQWYTALYLHELFNANSDPVTRDQAVKAYRSVLQNFFGSVTFFPSGVLDANGNEIVLPSQLDLLTADNVYRPAATGYASLFSLPGDTPGETQVRVLEAIRDWGFTYVPCSANCPVDGVVSVNVF